MRFLRVTDDTTRPDLEQAIAHLRDKQRRCRMASYRDELAADIDELLELWTAATPAERESWPPVSVWERAAQAFETP